MARDGDADATVELTALAGGEAVGVPSLRQAAFALGAALWRPGAVLRQARTLAAELGAVVVGASELQPRPRDARFGDEAWTRNLVFRRVLQTYLATSGALERLVTDFEASTDDDR